MSHPNKEKKSRLVYSTDPDQVPALPPETSPLPPVKKTIYLKRETKGRGGKTVTLITGLVLPADQLEILAAELKRICGSGGSVKDNLILIQGDHRLQLKSLLEKRGYPVKLAGG